jgi:Xaa-Pro aminopeptidase
MSAQTVIRVKRRRSEASLDALLLACKRQKCEETGVEIDTVTTLVKLAGTVEKLVREIFNLNSQYNKTRLSSLRMNRP